MDYQNYYVTNATMVLTSVGEYLKYKYLK